MSQRRNDVIPNAEEKATKTGFNIKATFIIVVVFILAFLLLYISKGDALLKNSCEVEDMRYDHAQSFDSDDGCNVCRCDNGLVSCTERSCTDTVIDPETENAIQDGELLVSVTPEVEWKEYKYANQYASIEFMYPATWSLEDDNSDKEYNVTIANGEYKFIVTSDSGDSSLCFFPDTSSKYREQIEQGPFSEFIEIEKYVQFGDTELYRRGINDQGVYTVCTFNSTNNAGSSIWFPTRYEVPKSDLDEGILKIMDEIFLSFELN